ncbi:MAG: alcohol dehydrogenase catalytic domain-containing protein [Nanoarchaeota archaeon]
MKAITISKRGRIDYQEVKEPKIKKGFVKIKVKATGLCGSDIQKIFSDKKALSSVETDIWGHEIAGIVHEVGESVGDFKKNDRVVINPLIRNKWGDDITKVKSIGKNYQGGFSEFVFVPSKNLRKIPKIIKFEEAILTDSIAVALHGYNLSESPTKKNVLVIGDGSLALITGLICLEFKNEVSIIGKNNRNLKLASDFGINTLKNEDIEKSKKYYDIIFEVVGRKQDKTLQQSIRLIKPRGKIIVLGVFEKNFLGKIPLRDFFYKEGKIIGSNSYGFFNGKDEFDMAINLLERLKTRLSKIITHVVPLKKFKEGLNLIKNKKESGVIKLVFEP